MDNTGEQTRMEGYESSSRDIIQLVDKLRDEGASFDIDLPTIVFCGNQSAGKSSLIEAISGIKLPRSEGTCTRCPMEVRLCESSQSWCCSVSLQYSYGKDSERLEKPKEIVFHSNITNEDHVELAVRRAQKAILNPKTNPLSFVNHIFDDRSSDSRQADAASNEYRFTLNTVCVKIVGARVNLTLIDLPGMIRSTENTSDNSSVGIIEYLVYSNIKNPRALIIATISCKDEIENQAIISMAKKADPEGLRTIGVLTKPDTIEANCHEVWHQILSNKRYRLNLGYYIVKNPNKLELDQSITFEVAREKEQQYFHESNPWSKSKPSIKARMGVKKLREALSAQLITLIECSLPEMRKKVNELLDLSTTELSKLPPPLSHNPKIELLNRIRSYCGCVKNNLTASGVDKKFYQSLNKNFITLNEGLYATRPLLLLPKKKSSTETVSTIQSDSIAIVYGDLDDEDFEEKESYFTGERIKAIIDRQRGREFSQFLKFEALEEIMSSCQNTWIECATSCLTDVGWEMRKLSQSLISLTFGRFKTLSKKVSMKVEEHIAKLIADTQEKIVLEVEMERSYPVTWSPEALNAAIAKFHEHMEMPLNEEALRTFKNSRKEKIADALFKLSFIGIPTNEKTLATLIPNQYDTKNREIIEISQAYYQVSQSRFGDHIPMIITKFFINDFVETVESYLLEELGVLDSDDSVIGGLVAEDPIVSSKRNDLNAKVKRLREVKRRISS